MLSLFARRNVSVRNRNCKYTVRIEMLCSLSVCVITLLLLFLPLLRNEFFAPNLFCASRLDEKCCSLERPNSATAAPGSVPALLSMMNLVCATCGRVAVVTITKTLRLLPRYGTKTLMQALLSIPHFPFLSVASLTSHVRDAV